MKENWRRVRLGDVCDLQNGFAFKSDMFNQVGKYKVIKIKELKQNKILFTKETSRVDVDIKDYDKYVIDRGTVLIALTGDPVSKPNPGSWVGRVSIYNYTYYSLLNQRVAKISGSNCGEVDNQFLYYNLMQDESLYRLASNAAGSANQANISNAIVNTFEINLPPLPEQKKIAKILSSIDDKIENNNAISRNLEEMAAALYKRWFVDFEFPNENGEPYKSSGGEFIDSELGMIPKDWGVGGLGDICLFKNGAKVKSADGEYPVYGGNGVMGKSYEHNAQNILIIGRVGANCGNIYSYSRKCWVNDNAISCKSKLSKSQEFCYYLLKCFDINSMHIGSTQPLITQGILTSIDCVVPPTEYINSFDTWCIKIRDKLDINIKENTRLAELRDSLLPKLMNGEIDVSNIELDIKFV